MTDSTTAWFDEAFADAPLMAILRGMGVERSVALATTAWDLGIDSVELPLQKPEDEAALREVARLGAERGKVVGAGTIISVEQIDVGEPRGGTLSRLARDSTRRSCVRPRMPASRSCPGWRRRATCSSGVRSVSRG